VVVSPDLLHRLFIHSVDRVPHRENHAVAKDGRRQRQITALAGIELRKDTAILSA